MFSNKSKTPGLAPVTSVTTDDIQLASTPIHVINRLKEASGLVKPFVPPTDTITIVQYSPAFSSIIGPSPTHSLLVSSVNPHFHEACVYTPSSSSSYAELWITSNILPVSAGQILISKLKLERSLSSPSSSTNDIQGAGPVTSTTWTKMRPPNGVHMPNGAVNAPFVSSLTSSTSSSNHSNGILICVQGSDFYPTTPETPGGIFHMSSSGTKPLITSYLGRPFNSPNDVVVHSDGSVWFTDPQYGFDQGFKTKPNLPNQVYRYDPCTGDVRVVADGMGRPNGIAFSPVEEAGERVVYVTDTDTSQGGKSDDPGRAATIYCWDIVYPSSSSPSSASAGGMEEAMEDAPPYSAPFTQPGQRVEGVDTLPPSYDASMTCSGPGSSSGVGGGEGSHPAPCSPNPPYLTNKRIFAYVSPGFPDGIKCDTLGNVYSGCGDGVHVWDKYGTFLGKIATGSWVANFCFGEQGELFICNETKVWRVQLNPKIRGALLGL